MVNKGEERYFQMRIFPQEYHTVLVIRPLDLGKGHIICGLAITCVCPAPALPPTSGERPFPPWP